MKFKLVLLMAAILSGSVSANYISKKEVKKQKYENGIVILYDDNTCDLVLDSDEQISLNVDDSRDSFDVKDFSINNGVITITSTEGKKYEYNGISNRPLKVCSYPGPGRLFLYQERGDGSRSYVHLTLVD